MCIRDSLSSEQKDLIDQTILVSHFLSKETFLCSDLYLFDQNPFSPYFLPVKSHFLLLSFEQNDLIDQTILITHFQSRDLSLFRPGPFWLKPFSPNFLPVKSHFLLLSSEQIDLIDQTILSWLDGRCEAWSVNKLVLVNPKFVFEDYGVIQLCYLTIVLCWLFMKTQRTKWAQNPAARGPALCRNQVFQCYEAFFSLKTLEAIEWFFCTYCEVIRR